MSAQMCAHSSKKKNQILSINLGLKAKIWDLKPHFGEFEGHTRSTFQYSSNSPSFFVFLLQFRSTTHET